MPELPEVERLRSELAAAIPKGEVTGVYRSRYPLRIGKHWSRATEGIRVLRGARMRAVRRHGKHLLVDFSGPSSAAQNTLLVHLGMSGRLELVAKASRPKHTHFELDFASGKSLRFVDPRRFGGLRCAPTLEMPHREPLRSLGPDALSPLVNGEYLHGKAGRRTLALREVLLNQKILAGVGNIYAIEALWDARLDPRIPAKRLTGAAWARLARAVRRALEGGLRRGGTTLKDYRGLQGSPGENQHALAAYGRGGEPCPRCGATLQAYVLHGRGGVLCPKEQRHPRRGQVR